MIERLQLSNYQSHKDSTLELVPGINCIIGPSNQGKTAVLRAVRWVWTNRPRGTAHVSHWAWDKKGNQAESCQVSLLLSGGKVTRFRDKDKNAYRVNGKELEAVKSDVPEQVADAFNWGQVNFQQQMDAPFLLSSSPGEVARFFNLIVDLSDIDQMLKAAESDRRQTARKTKEQEAEKEEKEKELSALDWIEEAEALEAEAQGLIEKVEDKGKEKEELGSKISAVIQAKEKLDALPDIPEGLENRLAELEKMTEQAEEKRVAVGELAKETHKLRLYQKEAGRDYSPIKKAMDAYSETEQDLYDTKQDISDISRFFRQSADYMEKIQKRGKEVRELRKKLPDVCPTCGAPLKGEV